MMMVTVPSVHGGIIRTEYIEPGAGDPVAAARTRDFGQQADAYQAIAEAVNDSPTGGGRVMGIISTQFHYFDQSLTGNTHDDKGANVRGKPAEWVLGWWFKRW